MKKLIVTEESLERAKRVFSANRANSPYSTCVAFEMALDALFVPEQQELKPLISAGATLIEGK